MAAPVKITGEAAEVLAAYAEFLRVERRLAPLTVRTRRDVISRFLRFRAQQRAGLALSALSASDVHAFVVHEGERLAVSSTRTAIESLRCFLRFLFVTGVTATDLSGAAPSVAGYRHTGPPRIVDAATVRALLEACDRNTVTGRRDYAVLLFMVRMGLRAIEVARLRLDDIDWRAGEITVIGKGGYRDQLPLLPDVGEAVVDYLRQGRPAWPIREVFLRALPPPGPLGRNGVVMVPREASQRAGVPIVGAHRLRHTAATSLLRAGASLREVGQVLRHHSDQQTALYALVDVAALSRVVRPWPVSR
jgi:site-specific recombinase XerD